MGGKRRGLLRPHADKIAMLHRLVDAGWIIAAHVAATRIYPEPWDAQRMLAAAAGVITFHILGEATDLYRVWRGVPVRQEVATVWMTWLFVVPVLLFLAFVTKTSEEHSRLISLLWFGLAPAFLSVWRIGLRLVLREMRRRDYNTRWVAVVGATDTGLALAEHIRGEPWTGLRMHGFYDDRAEGRRTSIPPEHGEIRGSLRELVDRARAGDVDIVYVALPLRAESRIHGLLHELADTTASVYVVADFFAYDLLRAEWTSVGDIPLVSIVETPFNGIDAGLKRLEDLALGLVFTAIAGLPMALIALGIKLTSPGPVLFRQRRYGLNGEQIMVLKFRTMTVCEDGGQIRQATKGDARVTKLGAFLRSTSLDELPQLLNVITGEMSIVGPRPHAVSHNEQYRRIIHGYMLRHKVKPGITGWAQVNGWRGETDTLEKMQMRIKHDLDYIRSWSLSFDLKIILLTVFGSSTRRNAF